MLRVLPDLCARQIFMLQNEDVAFTFYNVRAATCNATMLDETLQNFVARITSPLVTRALLTFVFDCYVSDPRALCFMFDYCVSDSRALCFVFDCYVSDSRAVLCLIGVLLIKSNQSNTK